MTLFDNSLHLDHLLIIQDIEVETAQDFCQVALQFLRNGIQDRLVEKAAKKLNWPSEKLQSAIMAIMELFRNAIKLEVCF